MFPLLGPVMDAIYINAYWTKWCSWQVNLFLHTATISPVTVCTESKNGLSVNGHRVLKTTERASAHGDHVRTKWKFAAVTSVRVLVTYKHTPRYTAAVPARRKYLWCAQRHGRKQEDFFLLCLTVSAVYTVSIFWSHPFSEAIKGINAKFCGKVAINSSYSPYLQIIFSIFQNFGFFNFNNFSFHFR